MLKIDKNTWHFKAYQHWIYDYCEKVDVRHFDGRARNTSLCVYFKRVFFGIMAITLETLSSLVVNAIWLCLWPIFALCALLCGFIPNTWKSDGWKPYRPFVRFSGRQYHLSIFTMPISFLICIMGLPYVLTTPSNIDFIGFSILGILIIIATSLFYLVSEASLKYFGIDNSFYKEESEGPKEKKPSLVFEYLKSKKEKVCPLVSFDD